MNSFYLPRSDSGYYWGHRGVFYNSKNLNCIGALSFFNSRTAIAGAIIGLLLVFLFRRRNFCDDHMTSQLIQICFLFIRSCNFNWNACVTSFSAFSAASFLFICVIKFLVTLDLPHSQKWLRHFEIETFIYFHSKR